jgi:hypothetical protein
MTPDILHAAPQRWRVFFRRVAFFARGRPVARLRFG